MRIIAEELLNPSSVRDSKERVTRKTKTTLDRQYQPRHNNSWTNIDKSLDLTKEWRMDIIHSHPLPFNKSLASGTDENDDDDVYSREVILCKRICCVIFVVDLLHVVMCNLTCTQTWHLDRVSLRYTLKLYKSLAKNKLCRVWRLKSYLFIGGKVLLTFNVRWCVYDHRKSTDQLVILWWTGAIEMCSCC